MKTFYAVTAGGYSDYHVIAITDSKESAEISRNCVPKVIQNQ